MRPGLKREMQRVLDQDPTSNSVVMPSQSSTRSRAASRPGTGMQASSITLIMVVLIKK